MNDLTERLLTALRDMSRTSDTPTHWLVTEEVRLQLLSRATAQYATCENVLGLPFFVDRDLSEEPGFVLCSGRVPDRHREDQLKESLVALQRRYRDEAEPMIKELAEIEGRKPRRLFVPLDTPFLQHLVQRSRGHPGTD